MQRKRIVQWCAALASLGLFVSACSSGNGGDGSDNGDGGEPAPGRTTLQVGSLTEPPNLVPYEGHGSKVHVHSAMLMPLLWTDAENQIYSDALESWEQSEDGRTVTLRVQDGIEWNDGTPMTSADILMSLEHYLDPSLSFQAGSITGVVGLSAFLDGEADSVAGLSAPDEHTVVIELEEPSPWLARLAGAEGIVILPEHMLGDVPHDELAEHEYFETFPVTNGPYNFVEAVDGQHVELERNPNWSLGEAGFERLFVKWLEQAVAPAQLETGEVQYIMHVDPADADRVEALDSVSVQATSSVQPVSWGLMYNEPIQDARVRQAMMYAIDREGICEELYAGYCSVPATNIPQIAPEWAIPTDDVIEYTYDPDRARELLDEAGWDSSNELTFLNWNTGSSRTSMNAIIQGNLAEVGINWVMDDVDNATLGERSEESPESFHGYDGAGGNFAVDPAFVRPLFACDEFYPQGQNRGRYCNEELDELLDAGQVETDQEQRAEIYQEAFRIINEEVPDLYVLYPDNIMAHDSRLQGVAPHGQYAGQLWNIGDWTWQEEE